jgi:hypothetical protein
VRLPVQGFCLQDFVPAPASQEQGLYSLVALRHLLGAGRGGWLVPRPIRKAPWMVIPGDISMAASVSRVVLAPHAGDDWSVPAGELAWSCRDTLDHVSDALMFYAGSLAVRAEEWIPFPRIGDHSGSVDDLIETMLTCAVILERVIEAASPADRGFHPAGMADPDGFAAMACNEILVHSYDVAEGLDVDFVPPDDLCGRVLARLFPWAPADGEGWPTLLWAAGRAPTGSAPRLDSDWWVHSAPLDEWTGEVKRRPG